MLSNQAKATMDVVDALEAAKVPRDDARKAAMSLADYIDELHRASAERLDERFKAMNTVFDERFKATTSIMDGRFKVNEERIKTMFWKGVSLLVVVILITNPAAVSLLSKVFRLN